MAKSAGEKGNDKVQPRLSPEMHQYLEDLVATGFYGKNKTQVAQRLIENGIMKAIADRHIDIRKKPKS